MAVALAELGVSGNKTILANITNQSENRVARTFDQLGLVWEYEPTTFYAFELQRKKKRKSKGKDVVKIVGHKPDFVVFMPPNSTEKKVYVEVTESPETRHPKRKQEFIMRQHGNHAVFLFGDDLIDPESAIIEKLVKPYNIVLPQRATIFTEDRFSTQENQGKKPPRLIPKRALEPALVGR